MTTLREAAQQALEACEQRLPLKGQAAIIDELNNLRTALAEQIASKPWVGLTEEERTDICDDYRANIHWRVFQAVEAKLQEKNT